jgi:hypothetical protein
LWFVIYTIATWLVNRLNRGVEFVSSSLYRNIGIVGVVDNGTVQFMKTNQLKQYSFVKQI